MKKKLYILIFMLSMVMTTGYTQEKSRKELKEEIKLEKEKQTDALINSREFVFLPELALSSTMGTFYLSMNQNFIKFHPDLIDSYMPFFGRAYSGIGYGPDTGLSFTGKPEKFKIEKKRKGFLIDVMVKGVNDDFFLFLTVGAEGNASVTISSNNRSTITYQGVVIPLEKAENK
jgi:hypothetical protein